MGITGFKFVILGSISAVFPVANNVLRLRWCIALKWICDRNNADIAYLPKWQIWRQLSPKLQNKDSEIGYITQATTTC